MKLLEEACLLLLLFAFKITRGLEPPQLACEDTKIDTLVKYTKFVPETQKDQTRYFVSSGEYYWDIEITEKFTKDMVKQVNSLNKDLKSIKAFSWFDSETESGNICKRFGNKEFIFLSVSHNVDFST